MYDREEIGECVSKKFIWYSARFYFGSIL